MPVPTPSLTGHPIIDALGTILIFVVAGVLTKLGLNRPAAPTPATPTTDAVVVSGAFADAAPMRKLNDQLAELDTTLSSLNRCTRLHAEEQQHTTDATNRLADNVRDLKELLEDRLPRSKGLV